MMVIAKLLAISLVPWLRHYRGPIIRARVRLCGAKADSSSGTSGKRVPLGSARPHNGEIRVPVGVTNLAGTVSEIFFLIESIARVSRLRDASHVHYS